MTALEEYNKWKALVGEDNVPMLADAAIAELKEAVGHLLGQLHLAENQVEVVREELGAEVERLTWMLEEFIAPEIRDEVIADLARRWEEEHL